MEDRVFRLQSKNLFLTYPKCEVAKEDALVSLQKILKIDKYIIAREKHEDGTNHLHAYIELEKKREFKAHYLDLQGHHGNYQGCKNKYSTQKYVKKGGDFITNIEELEERHKATESHKRFIGRKLLEQPLKDLVEEHPELIFGYKKLKQDIEQYHLDKMTPAKHIPRDNLWIMGPPGIGKSYWARETYPTLYEKSQNKWWDGYQGQDVVLLDDLDSKQLGHLIKIWADNYSFYGETKGGTLQPQYTRLIVTSNYSPKTLWADDEMFWKAIERRFKICTISEKVLEQLNN